MSDPIVVGAPDGAGLTCACGEIVLVVALAAGPVAVCPGCGARYAGGRVPDGVAPRASYLAAIRALGPDVERWVVAVETVGAGWRLTVCARGEHEGVVSVDLPSRWTLGSAREAVEAVARAVGGAHVQILGDEDARAALRELLTASGLRS